MAKEQEKIIENCDLCLLVISLTPGQEVIRFEEVWHSSLTLTLCPDCKLSEDGLGMIIAAKRREREVLDNFVW